MEMTEPTKTGNPSKIPFRMGAENHVISKKRVVEENDNDDVEEDKVVDDETRAEARAEQRKRASVDYQVLLALESPYFVVLVCILVILDVRLSAQNDLSSSAVTFQAWVTGFFLLELIARAYYHSELHDIKVFMLNPLTIVDCFALLMDLIVFAANADSDDPGTVARAINVIRLARFVKAADWSAHFHTVRTSKFCLILCGSTRDTTNEDNLHDEQKKNRDKMRKLGIFLPTETVEAAERPPDMEDGPDLGVTVETTPVAAWRNAKVVRINVDDTYMIKYDESGKIWMGCPKGRVRRDMRQPTSVMEIVDDTEDDTMKQEPNTWQYKCLKFQESPPATFVVCLIVFLELFLVNSIEDDGARLGWSLAVSFFFFFELVLRMHVYLHTYGDFSGFFTDPFRVLDLTLVVIDMILLVLVYTVGGLEDARAVKLVRVARLARNAKAIRSLKSLRSLKFIKSLLSCDAPTSPEKTLRMLNSLPWTFFVVAIVVAQYIFVTMEMRTALIGERTLTLFNVILAGFFLVEVSLRLGLYCMLRDSSLAFCRDDWGVNFVDMGVVIVDVAVIAMSLLASSTVADESSTIKLFRLVRLARCVSLSGVAESLRSLKGGKPSEGLTTENALGEEEKEGGSTAAVPAGSDLVVFTGNRGVKYADGCIYQGNWVNGFEEGVGQLTFPNGDKYKGSFKGGMKSGRGLFLFGNGDQYKGSFSRNQKHGAGTYKWVDGDTFEAMFERGAEHGKATFFSTDGRTTEYYFEKGKEVAAPEDAEQARLEAAKQFARLSFKDILTPGDGQGALL